MHVLTPASAADDLPPLGELIADGPFWRYLAGTRSGDGIAHPRVWMALAAPPGRLAVVTVTGPPGPVIAAAGSIPVGLARR